MQLKNALLATAASSLLGLQPSMAAEWEHEASVLYYGESDDRVQDASIKYRGKRTSDNGDSVSLNLGVDTLTGASPTGAAISSQVQTITSPSGNATTSYAAGELPLDDFFKDTRISSSASWNKGISDDMNVTIGGSVSLEYDYTHLGINAGLDKSFNQKNTTVSGGVSFANDTIDAVGGIPKPLTPSGSTKGASDDSKQITELMLGVTQVLSKGMIGQFNYGYSNSDGYLNDPYKYVSQVDNTGAVTSNVYESRPDKRTGHNLYGALKWKPTNKLTSTSSLRYHTDDWGIDSITLDQKLRIGLTGNKSIEPHVRYYTQSKADFYKDKISATEPLPQHISADYRLAEFDAITVGATYRWQDTRQREWRITSEYYQQSPTVEGTSNKGLDAAILSLGVKF